MESRNPLAVAFIDDHKHLIRGLRQILRAVEAGEMEQARTLADEVDRLAGPHIEFEEEVLYPELARVRGKPFANRLYSEHGTALQAIQTLLNNAPPPEGDERANLVKGLRTGLDHAISCGTLLSHLTTLDEARQDKVLQQLEECRRRSRRWTELAAP